MLFQYLPLLQKVLSHRQSHDEQNERVSSVAREVVAVLRMEHNFLHYPQVHALRYLNRVMGIKPQA